MNWRETENADLAAEEMHNAAIEDNTDTLKTLLMEGAEIDAIWKDVTPLQAAIDADCVNTTTLLLRAGANKEVKDPNGWTPLYTAAYWGRMQCVSILLEHDVNVNNTNKNGDTALHFSVLENNIPLTEELIWARADLSKRTKAGYTPMHLAILLGYYDMVVLLHNMGADINESHGATTSLAIAKLSMHHKIVKFLTECLSRKV
jgi:ankyrin repeat protein